MIKSAAALAVIAAAVTLTGCSSSGAPSASKETVTATSTVTQTVTVRTTVTSTVSPSATSRRSSTPAGAEKPKATRSVPAQKVAQPTRTHLATTKPKPGASLTNQQQNAVSSAQNYLSFSGFSRQGLIDQLSSAYGDQYSVHDATVAVDSLHENWSAQAVRSAKQYLKLQGFSCNGLIAQLDSAYGDKYTLSQATYGAHHAGAC